MAFHISALSVQCERGTIMVSGRKHFQAVSTDSQSLSRIEGLWVGLSRKWKTIPGKISLMKHDLWRPFYTLSFQFHLVIFLLPIAERKRIKIISNSARATKWESGSWTWYKLRQWDWTGQDRCAKSHNQVWHKFNKRNHSTPFIFEKERKTKTKTKKTKSHWTAFR